MSHAMFFKFQVLVHWVHCTLQCTHLHEPLDITIDRNLLLFQWVREGSFTVKTKESCVAMY